MSAATSARTSKEKGPTDGPFAALWLLLRELLSRWNRPGGRNGFEAAFAVLEDQMKATLLAEAIKAHNAEHPDNPLVAEDFEIRAVRRGRRVDYDVFARSGRSLEDEIEHRWAEAARAFFRQRALLARYQRWTWVRKGVRGKLSNAYARIGRAGRARLRSRRSLLAGVSALALAASARAPP